MKFINRCITIKNDYLLFIFMQEFIIFKKEPIDPLIKENLNQNHVYLGSWKLIIAGSWT